MVVFTCNNCGESLKKKDVEKHSNIRCRGVPNLTCVDCLKDFRDDYIKHTVCVSEDQRYSAKGLSGASQKSKQQQWVETVHDAVGRAIDDGTPGITHSIQQLMLWLQDQATIPDKAKSFTNYIKNARRSEPPQNIDFVWKILDKARVDFQAKLQAEREAEKKAKDELKQKKKEEKKESSSDDSDSSDEEAKEKRKEIVKNNVSEENEGCRKKNKKDKKDKKKRMVSESESVINGSSEFRKSKKSKRDTEGDDSEESGNLNSAFDACHLNVEPSVDDQKLSKKERKEKKRREKYEAEMKEIESAPTAEDENGEEETQEANVEETEDKKSKKKKNKRNKTVEENPEVDDEATGEKKKKKDKKSKKKNKEDDMEQMETEVSSTKLRNGNSDTCKLNETLNVEDLQNEKFSWDAAILQVLEAEEEISLKKLTKKVCNHYLQSLGEYSQNDEITALTKFNKKLHKMHNVLVHKERVKLKTSRD